MSNTRKARAHRPVKPPRLRGPRGVVNRTGHRLTREQWRRLRGGF